MRKQVLIYVHKISHVRFDGRRREMKLRPPSAIMSSIGKHLSKACHCLAHAIVPISLWRTNWRSSNLHSAKKLHLRNAAKGTFFFGVYWNFVKLAKPRSLHFSRTLLITIHQGGNSARSNSTLLNGPIFAGQLELGEKSSLYERWLGR